MRRIVSDWPAILHKHYGLALVMGAAAALRISTLIAYWPALYNYDSISYLEQANSGLFLNPYQPGGYPLVIRGLRLLSHSLGLLTIVQHLAGLLTGVIVYLVVWRLGRHRLLAAVAAAIVVLDGYLIAVEQYVMTDALFGLLLTASSALLILSRRRTAILASGALLGIACTIRPVALFCFLVWIAFVLWRHRWSVTLVLGIAALVAPVLAYAAANDAQTGRFGLTADTAWVLYGRIGAIGDCRKVTVSASERVLCPQQWQLGHNLNWYVLDPGSPAVRAFRPPALNAPSRVDSALFGFAFDVMSQRPLQYLRLIGGDVARYFVPGANGDNSPEVDVPITLPPPGPWLLGIYRYYPRQRSPAGALRGYASVVHTARPLLALLLVLGLVGLVLKTDGAADVEPGTRAAALLSLAMGLIVLCGAALTIGFQRRYELPAVPLLATAGMLGATLIMARLRTRATQAPAARLEAMRA